VLSVLFIGALLAAHQVDAQHQTAPIFHAEAYVVTELINFVNRDGTVTRGLTSADVRATIDKRPVALDVSEDPKKPGFYVLSINPPNELRDGKSHRIDLKVRNGDRWRDLPIKWTAVFDKPR